MATNENVEKAKTALGAAGTALSNPQSGSFENANALALIGIGHALVAIAEGPPGLSRADAESYLKS